MKSLKGFLVSLFSALMLFATVASVHAADVFVGLDHSMVYDNLDRAQTYPEIGVAFKPHKYLDIEVAGRYMDSKVLDADLSSPNDEWRIGFQIRSNLISF